MTLQARGPLLALISAVLFGISPVLIKATLGDMSPLMVAGMLYLGSGIGLFILLLIQKGSIFSEVSNLSLNHKIKLLGATLAGGVLAPVCLTYGIKLGTAFEVSLLLNFETVATTLIAAFFFHEHVSKNVWVGKVLIVLGALLVTLNFNGNASFSVSALLIVGACILWGVDNNLTRDIESLSPAVLASMKGFSAGAFNIFLAIALGQSHLKLGQSAVLLTIGAFSYGLSLVLFVKALRLIGSARTSTYFAIGPFVGMLTAVLLLKDHPANYQWIASVFMFAGVWALYREKHEHLHTHEPMTHGHTHLHDEHHHHVHNGSEGSEPHDHVHVHEPLVHSHPHLPDIHHRHQH